MAAVNICGEGYGGGLRTVVGIGNRNSINAIAKAGVGCSGLSGIPKVEVGAGTTVNIGGGAAIAARTA